jgi:hypothetical protein
MNPEDEKRVSKRHDHQAAIIFAYHNTDQFFPALMCNYSKDGMCFETPFRIDPGADIYIMMENYSPDTIHAELYEGYFAEVLWCCEITDTDPCGYKIGVKYYKTVID